jgi:hypothetical protein
VDERLKKWRGDGEHLPDFMRDFHDQKNLFKTIHEQAVSDPNAPSWMGAHVYTLDAFLWFMARHGYTLQKSRARLAFDDIGETLGEAHRERQAASAVVLKGLISGMQAEK